MCTRGQDVAISSLFSLCVTVHLFFVGWTPNTAACRFCRWSLNNITTKKTTPSDNGIESKESNKGVKEGKEKGKEREGEGRRKTKERVDRQLSSSGLFLDINISHRFFINYLLQMSWHFCTRRDLHYLRLVLFHCSTSPVDVGCCCCWISFLTTHS